jgi:hypothetical protein
MTLASRNMLSAQNLVVMTEYIRKQVESGNILRPLSRAVGLHGASLWIIQISAIQKAGVNASIIDHECYIMSYITVTKAFLKHYESEDNPSTSHIAGPGVGRPHLRGQDVTI